MGLIYNAKFDLSKASKMKKEESQTQGRSKSVQNIFDNFNWYFINEWQQQLVHIWLKLALNIK